MNHRQMTASRSNMKYKDYIETVAEEVEMMTGLNTTVKNNRVVCDTIAGKVSVTPSEATLMADVYRIISHIGSRMYKWGLEHKLKAL